MLGTKGGFERIEAHRGIGCAQLRASIVREIALQLRVELVAMSGQFRLFVEPLLVRVQRRGFQRHFFQLPKRSGARFVPIDHIVTGGTGAM